MFRKLFFPTLLLCLFAFPVFSQMTIGSTAAPAAGAVLDLESTNQGILFPRVSLSATGTWGLLGSPTAGMVVYNTNASISGTGAQGIGLYYWNSSMSTWNYVQNGAISANNGLTYTAGSPNLVQLGGSLIQSTTITQPSSYNLIDNLTGSGDFQVQKSGTDILHVYNTNSNVGINGVPTSTT